MARPLRIQYAGAVYHITARGNERKPIFQKEDDLKKFVSILKEAKEKGPIIIYGYVLMPNHYHLLIETPEGNLSKVMHDLQTRYTIYFNRRYKRVGHLFQGRYKALIVDKEAYLLELSRYIHLNPVRAKIVQRPEDYRWSSYKDYTGEKGEITDTAFILNRFSEEGKEAKEGYQRFVEEGKGISQTDLKKNIYGQLIIGTKEFTERIKGKIEELKVSPEVPEREKIRKRKSMDKILEEVSQHYQIPREELLIRKGRWNEARKIGIYLVRKHTNIELKLLAELFGGVHYSAISQIVRGIERRRLRDKELDRAIRVIEDKL